MSITPLSFAHVRKLIEQHRDNPGIVAGIVDAHLNAGGDCGECGSVIKWPRDIAREVIEVAEALGIPFAWGKRGAGAGGVA